MAGAVLFPITRDHIDEAIGMAPQVAAEARTRRTSVLVLQTECLHGWLTDVDEAGAQLETRLVQEATGRVADAIRSYGADVETVWECVRVHRRPVGADLVRRLGAATVFVAHPRRPAGVFEAMTLRHMRREGIDVVHPTAAGRQPAVRERLPGWDD